MILRSRWYCLQMHFFGPLWILFLLIFWLDLFLMFCLPCLSVSIPNTILGKNRVMLGILKPFSSYSLHSCGRSRRRRIWQGKKFLCWTWGNRKMKTCSTRLFPASRTLCLPAQSWQMKLPDFWWCLAWRIKDLKFPFQRPYFTNNTEVFLALQISDSWLGMFLLQILLQSWALYYWAYGEGKFGKSC